MVVGNPVVAGLLQDRFRYTRVRWWRNGRPIARLALVLPAVGWASSGAIRHIACRIIRDVGQLDYLVDLDVWRRVVEADEIRRWGVAAAPEFDVTGSAVDVPPADEVDLDLDAGRV